MEKVLFVCDRYPELNLVLDSKDIVSNEKTGRTHAYAGKEVHFVKKAFEGRFRGELEVSDKDVLEFLRAHEWYGKIIREAVMPSPSSRVQPEKVSSGTTDSGTREPEAPVETPETMGKARVPNLRGRPKKLVAA